MKYLISETTKEERLAIAKKALAISLSGAESPSEDAIKLVNQYIEGEKELVEIQKEIVEKYKREDEEVSE